MARTTTGAGEVRLLLEILKRIPSDRKISSTELLTVLENSGFTVNKTDFSAVFEKSWLRPIAESCVIVLQSRSDIEGRKQSPALKP